MISKNQIKLIKSLQQKKYRKQHKKFVAEGVKVIQELLNSNYDLAELFTTQEQLFEVDKDKIHLVSESELKSISCLVTPNLCLAIFSIPNQPEIPPTNALQLVLDDIRDPGNLGTIIRLADWFGITSVVCSPSTVDAYNPKVIQATMGSIARVNLWYVHLKEYLSEAKTPVYGTFLEGESIYKESLLKPCLIVLGNESNGISKEIEKKVTHKITIPQFGMVHQTESLNVATATAIILSEFCRDTK
ncbi:MAG TPA: RNA methyltransferase [Flavobacterium sp.]|nr:RNA methyltransferase [Flavobacterium sp.]